ncbi:unnamed protein product [Schistocephalus solidus]|uniref:Secreted protein n=1 Tax=Schistocephalus solidus TaxID=70667 RepID=A0A183TKH4_SCHSO|nr:unnamed protein product [Schistocephalus solidus]
MDGLIMQWVARMLRAGDLSHVTINAASNDYQFGVWVWLPPLPWDAVACTVCRKLEATSTWDSAACKLCTFVPAGAYW